MILWKRSVRLAIAACLLTACGKPSSTEESPGPAPDPSDLPAPHDPQADENLVRALTIVSPKSPAHVRDRLVVRLQADGGVDPKAFLQVDGIARPGPVEIGKDLSIDVTEWTEGRHRVSAYALEGLKKVDAAPIEVVVDRTGPRVISAKSLSKVRGHEGALGLRVYMSEDMPAEAMREARFLVKDGDRSIPARVRATGSNWFDLLPDEATTHEIVSAQMITAPRDPVGFPLEVPEGVLTWRPPRWTELAKWSSELQPGGMGPSLATDSFHELFVGYATVQAARVVHFSESGSMSDVVLDLPGSRYPYLSMATAPSGNVLIATSQYSRTEPAIAKLQVWERASNGVWSDMSLGLESLIATPWNIAFAQGAGHHPALVWQDSSSSSPTEVVAATWDGNAWQRAGKVAFGQPKGLWITGAIARDGTPAALYGQAFGDVTFFGAQKVSVATSKTAPPIFGKWPLGASSHPEEGVFVAGFIDASDYPNLSPEGQLLLQQCTSDGCRNVHALPRGRRVGGPGAAVLLDDTNPIVAWTERTKDTTDSESRVARYIDGDWELLGTGLPKQASGPELRVTYQGLAKRAHGELVVCVDAPEILGLSVVRILTLQP